MIMEKMILKLRQIWDPSLHNISRTDALTV